MTPEQQQCLDLQSQGHSQQEIANITGLSRHAVRRRLQAANKWQNADPSIRDAAIAGGLSDPSALSHAWKITKDSEGNGYSLFIKNHNTDTQENIEDAIDAACDRLTKSSPVTYKPKYNGGNHMLVVSPADIHMGKLCEAMETGDTYTRAIAEARTKEGVSGLLEMAKGFGLECITINTGNDSLHVDNSKKTTTGGTPQDVDGSIFSMFDAMFDTWVWIIDTAATCAPVHVVFDPSNHPWVSDWMLNRAVMAYFKNDDRVTFDVKMNAIRHRKYQVYGSNLIGYSHGDGAKDRDLPNLMQYECREWWGKTQRGYWIIKHKHHKDAKTVGLSGYQQEKDHAGVTVIRSGDMALDKNVSVEIVRSPSGTDGWHDRKGYVGAIKAVECFLFHADRGQVARFTYPFY